MSKARIIGAGTAGSSIYNTNVNLNTAGGTIRHYNACRGYWGGPY